MIKLSLAILLTIISTSALADWTLIESENPARYIDKASISRKGNFAKMWDLADYVLPESSLDPAGNGKSYLSSVAYNEYDCSGRMIRMLGMSLFSENMKKGNIIEEWQGSTEWKYIIPGSVGESFLKIACGKK